MQTRDFSLHADSTDRMTVVHGDQYTATAADWTAATGPDTAILLLMMLMLNAWDDD